MEIFTEKPKELEGDGNFPNPYVLTGLRSDCILLKFVMAEMDFGSPVTKIHFKTGGSTKKFSVIKDAKNRADYTVRKGIENILRLLETLRKNEILFINFETQDYRFEYHDEE